MLVEASFSPPALQDVNLTEVGGVAITLGQTTMTASFPVVIASNQSAIHTIVDSGTLTAVTSITNPVAVTQSTSPWVTSLTSTTITSIVPGVGATNLGKAEDAGHTTGDTGVAVWAVRNDALATLTTTDLDYSPFAVNPAGKLAAASDGDYTAGADGESNTAPGWKDYFGNALYPHDHPYVFNGTNWDRMRGTTTGLFVQGNIADDSTTPSNPVQVGGIAKSPDGTDPGSVSTENDVTRAITDLNRRLYVNDAHPRSLNFHSDGSSALTDTSVAADPGDGFQIVVTSIIFSTGAATACNIFFEEGSSKVLGPWYLEAVAGRGVFWTGYKFITSSTALTVTTSASIAQSLDVGYYIQAV